MEHIHKLPFLLAGIAAMTVGIAGYASGSESGTIYLRMAVIMVVFFFIGLFVKNTVLSIEKEVQDKKREQEMAEEQLAAEAAVKQHTANPQQAAGQNGHKVDLIAEDTDDGFEPLALSKAISSKVKE